MSFDEKFERFKNLYPEKQLNFSEYLTEDLMGDSMEDSTEVQYVERTMYKSKKEQISDKEVENISTENTPKKDPAVTPPFLYKVSQKIFI
ncbi:uncharacterized protein LOC143903871 isoform X2 [Temnothorax americanus]|uniref:uncharacterized protein LOC143903871 isoform X2 n=1 Tax=Temnothorax americanus TaxID=1964332 RepID=UPI0040694A52